MSSRIYQDIVNSHTINQRKELCKLILLWNINSTIGVELDDDTINKIFDYYWNLEYQNMDDFVERIYQYCDIVDEDLREIDIDAMLNYFDKRS